VSAKLMGQVWELDLPHNHQSVLLAFADHANDAGFNAYPGTGYVAWKTGYSERQVQRIIDELEAQGLLVAIEPATGNKPTVYRVVVAAGTKKPDYEPIKKRRRGATNCRGSASPAELPSGVTERQGDKLSGRHSESSGGDTVVSPEPSGEPTSEPLASSTSATASPTEEAGSDGGGRGNGGAIPVTFGARNHQDALRDRRRASARCAALVLREVAEARGVEAPTFDAVEAAIEAFPTRHHMDALRKVEFNLLHGPGRHRHIVSLPALFRAYVESAPEVKNAMTPARPEPDTDWSAWVRDELPDYPPASDHFAAAVVRAHFCAIGGVHPSPDGIREQVESRYGPYRAAA
jgi:hypothetical protein